MFKFVLYVFFILILLAGVFIGIFFATGANEVYFPKKTTFHSVAPKTGKMVQGYQRSPLRSKFMQDTTKLIEIRTQSVLNGSFRHSSNACVASENGKWIVCLHYNFDTSSASEYTFAALFEVKGLNDFELTHQFRISSTVAKTNSNHLLRLPNGNIMALYHSGAVIRIGEIIIDETQKTMRIDERTNVGVDNYFPNFVASKDGNHLFFAQHSGNTVIIYKYTSDGRTLVKSQTHTLPTGTWNAYEHHLCVINENQLLYVNIDYASSARDVYYMTVAMDGLHEIVTPTKLIASILGSHTNYISVVVVEKETIAISISSHVDPLNHRWMAKIDLSTKPVNLGWNDIDWYKIEPDLYNETSGKYTKISDEVYRIDNVSTQLGRSTTDPGLCISYVNLKEKVPRILKSECRTSLEAPLASCRSGDLIYSIFLTFSQPLADEANLTDNNFAGYVIDTNYIKDEKVVCSNPDLGEQIVMHKSGKRNISKSAKGVVHTNDEDLIVGATYYVDEDGDPTIYPYETPKTYQSYPKPLEELGVAVSDSKILKI